MRCQEEEEESNVGCEKAKETRGQESLQGTASFCGNFGTVYRAGAVISGGWGGGGGRGVIKMKRNGEILRWSLFGSVPHVQDGGPNRRCFDRTA